MLASLPQVHLSGSAEERARAWARATAEARPDFVRALEERLQPLDWHLRRLEPELGRIEEEIARYSPGTLVLLRALEQALDIPYPRLRAYALASFVEDRLLLEARGEGCTTWAAAPPAAPAVFLAKNRDYELQHLPLQAVAAVSPGAGQAYLTLTSLGSPGVFSSGMNRAGLAVADSRVRSADEGPGLPVYALAEILLESCSTVPEAMEALADLPRLGGNNLVLADRSGDLALAELGHRRLGVVQSRGLVVNTNHYATPGLRGLTLGLAGEVRASRSRRRRLRAWLLRHAAALDDQRALALMASHRGGEAFCRHQAGGRGATISTVLYRPDVGRVIVVHGQPCTGQPLPLAAAGPSLRRRPAG